MEIFELFFKNIKFCFTYNSIDINIVK